jgi:transposase
MDSLSEIVDVVIGVDTHARTHSASAVNARTGGMLGQITVEATPQGYDELLEFASEHEGLRAWAIEETRSHGASSIWPVLSQRAPPLQVPMSSTCCWD